MTLDVASGYRMPLPLVCKITGLPLESTVGNQQMACGTLVVQWTMLSRYKLGSAVSVANLGSVWISSGLAESTAAPFSGSVASRWDC
eukprot:2453546-Rhodomonas_salina.1